MDLRSRHCKKKLLVTGGNGSNQICWSFVGRINFSSRLNVDSDNGITSCNCKRSQFRYRYRSDIYYSDFKSSTGFLRFPIFSPIPNPTVSSSTPWLLRFASPRGCSPLDLFKRASLPSDLKCRPSSLLRFPVHRIRLFCSRSRVFSTNVFYPFSFSFLFLSRSFLFGISAAHAWHEIRMPWALAESGHTIGRMNRGPSRKPTKPTRRSCSPSVNLSSTFVLFFPPYSRFAWQFGKVARRMFPACRSFRVVPLTIDIFHRVAIPSIARVSRARAGYMNIRWTLCRIRASHNLGHCATGDATC